MSKFAKYFNAEYKSLENKISVDIKSLLHDDMMLISGDFYGIQKFLFENLSTQNASKVLRAKSAFIQIFTLVIARYICQKIEIDEKYIISTNAGKFEILSPINNKKIVDNIQNKIDEYFIKNFYGLSGINIASISCKKEAFENSIKYKELRKNIAEEIELIKFKKFDLLNINTPVLNYDNEINNQTLCKICNIRKIENNNCNICDSFVKLGKRLTHSDEKKYSSEELGIIFDGFKTDIILDEKIKSYIAKDTNNEPATFEHLAKNSCIEPEIGIKALGILKADVDSMGTYLENSDITNNFDNFDMFSKTLDNFFSLHIPSLMREKYPDTYTVFAGGDDLFLVGAWDKILELSRVIHKEFEKFINKKLSISFGIAIAKPSTPISYLAYNTEHLLERSKALDEKKDAITLFGETVKWKSYLEVSQKLTKNFDKSIGDINTAFLYRLFDLCEMSKNINKDISNTMWKSKLNYSFRRNMDDEFMFLLTTLDETIEKYPSETKMFLCEYIYKRRKV